MSALEGPRAKVCDASPTRCSFQCDKPILLEDNAIATHLYRIAQEAISNAIKYSKASQVTVRLEKLVKCLVLVITDDGIGISKSRNGSGSGLNIIKHRARLIGATLDINTAPGCGTTIRCTFNSVKRRQR